MQALVKFLKEEKGATAVEYGLILTLIAVAIIAIVKTLGGNLKGSFEEVNKAMSNK